MNDLDFNSTKGKLILAVVPLILIFCLACCVKTFVYDEATDSTHVISHDDIYLILSGSHTYSTEEWERNIKAHNKANVDEIEITSSSEEIVTNENDS